MKKILKSVVFVLFWVVTTSGCSFDLVPPPEQPIEHYVLEDPNIAEVTRRTIPAPFTLLLQPTGAAPSLSSDRIVLSRDAATRGQYQYALWTDPTPIQFDKLLWERLTVRGATKLVTKLSSATLPDYVLQVELLEWHHDTVAGEVKLKVSAELSNLKEHRLVSAERFVARRPVGEADASHAVAAFGAANSDILNKLVAWVESNLQE